MIELLTVLSTIAVLAALAIPVTSNALESGKRAKCLANIKQIGLGLSNFSTDSNNRYPVTSDGSNTWDNLLISRGYLSKEVFICPSDSYVRTVSGDKRSYAYNGYFGDIFNNPNSLQGYIMHLQKPASQVILVADRGASIAVVNSPACANAYRNYDCTGNHKKAGANYVFADLHAEWLKDSGDYGQAITSNSTQLWLSHWYCQ